MLRRAAELDLLTWSPKKNNTGKDASIHSEDDILPPIVSVDADPKPLASDSLDAEAIEPLVFDAPGSMDPDSMEPLVYDAPDSMDVDTMEPFVDGASDSTDIEILPSSQMVCSTINISKSNLASTDCCDEDSDDDDDEELPRIVDIRETNRRWDYSKPRPPWALYLPGPSWAFE